MTTIDKKASEKDSLDELSKFIPQVDRLCMLFHVLLNYFHERDIVGFEMFCNSDFFCFMISVEAAAALDEPAPDCTLHPV